MEPKSGKSSHSLGVKDTLQRPIDIYPINGAFDGKIASDHMEGISKIEWDSIISTSQLFEGYDDKLFRRFFMIVYKKKDSGNICTITSSKFGITIYKDLILDSSSRFYPSCKNLASEYKGSATRKALAITNLKNFNKIAHHPGSLEVTKYWDETDAGFIASNMKLIKQNSQKATLYNYFELGLLQIHSLPSILLDVVYDNSFNSRFNASDENNKIVFHLGDQLNHLFDPFLEYSPERLDFTYTPPKYDSGSEGGIRSELIESTTKELIDTQANLMSSLVNLLQNFIIPLRIYVLENGKGIIKLNQIFPPTIDEITRINCVLHESLMKASHYGCMEVFKVLSSILPYFYKAFIRHEANMKCFPARLNKFHTKNKELIFDNPTINLGSFTIRDIDSIVSGSLLELPRLKLILSRLKSAVDNEIERRKKSDDFFDNISESLNRMFEQSVEVIDAFGDGIIDEMDVKRSNIRNFTPTGKILTEIASDWPPELHYGWLSRRAVGIYELRNIQPLDEKMNRDILIIFSDSLLFLTILDDNYTTTRGTGVKRISISDILMHCLVNERPIPHSMPPMRVSCWCSINDVFVTSYTSPDQREGMTNHYLRFLNLSETGFQSISSDKNNFTKLFEVIETSDSNTQNGHDIIELVNKARILSKNQSFHLFRSYGSNLRIYSTAHNVHDYQTENCQSMFCLFLNVQDFDPKLYFSKNSNLFFMLSATTVEGNRLEIKTYNRIRQFDEVDYVELNKLQQVLGVIINRNLQAIFTLGDDMAETLTKSYENTIECFSYMSPSNNDNTAIKDTEKSDTIEMKDMNLLNDLPGSEKVNEHEKHKSRLKGDTTTNVDDRVEVLTKKSRSRKSFVYKILHPFKSFRKEEGQKDALSSVKKAQNLTITTPPSSKMEREKKIKEENELNKANSTRNISSDSRSSILINHGFQFPINDGDNKSEQSLAMRIDCNSESESNYSSNVLNNQLTNRRSRDTRTAETSFAGSLSSTLVVQADNLKTSPEYFYNDGEANWVAIPYEDSAAVNSESKTVYNSNTPQRKDLLDGDPETAGKRPSSQPQTIGKDVGSKDLHSMDTSRNGSSRGFPFATGAIDDDINAVPFFLTNEKSDTLGAFSNPWTFPRDMSIQSLTSSQIVDEFSKRIDAEFNLTEEKIDFLAHRHFQHAHGHEDKEETGYKYNLMTSSEEEYFSMDELTHARFFEEGKSVESLRISDAV